MTHRAAAEASLVLGAIVGGGKTRNRVIPHFVQDEVPVTRMRSAPISVEKLLDEVSVE